MGNGFPVFFGAMILGAMGSMVFAFLNLARYDSYTGMFLIGCAIICMFLAVIDRMSTYFHEFMKVLRERERKDSG